MRDSKDIKREAEQLKQWEQVNQQLQEQFLKTTSDPNPVDPCSAAFVTLQTALRPEWVPDMGAQGCDKVISDFERNHTKFPQGHSWLNLFQQYTKCTYQKTFKSAAAQFGTQEAEEATSTVAHVLKVHSTSMLTTTVHQQPSPEHKAKVQSNAEQAGIMAAKLYQFNQFHQQCRRQYDRRRDKENHMKIYRELAKLRPGIGTQHDL